MKLSTRSRYGLRMLFEIALAYGKKPIMLSQIAFKEDMSLKYLSKLIIPLKAAGIVGSVRGAHGGYVLAKQPSEINLKEILETLEGDLFSVECLRQSSFCPRSKTCATRDVWGTIENEFLDILQKITLEQIVENHIKKVNGRETDYCI